jgi:AcrR family transcriptional regulator
MARDAEATKARLLAAATAEFAAYGIAGARIDRIAATAAANKNLIYLYFGNKEQLFATVLETHISALLDAVPLDATDLPGYAGRLYDFGLRNPDLVRLARWYSLENPGQLERTPLAFSSTNAKLDAVAAAQAGGLIDDGLPAEHLLALVLSIAMTWTEGNPEAVAAGDDPGTVAARRHAVVVAVRRLVRPAAN